MAPLLVDGSLALAATVIAAAGLVLGMYRLWRRRRDPIEQERLRRLRVNETGRTTDGTVVDIQQVGDDVASPSARLIFYEYSVRGVTYSTAQDISTLGDIVGVDLSRYAGSVNVKYRARNPSDSIVICEEWSGLLPLPSRSTATSHRTSTGVLRGSDVAAPS